MIISLPQVQVITFNIDCVPVLQKLMHPKEILHDTNVILPFLELPKFKTLPQLEGEKFLGRVQVILFEPVQ